MFRSTRRFIESRQPHTDFVVGTLAVAAYDPPHSVWDIVDSVGREVRINENWRFCAGWRVYPYDADQDRTRFEPWYFIIKPTDTGGFLAWDLAPTDQECEFLMDQALAVYRRAELEARLPGVRPCDLILHGDSWWLDAPEGLVPVDQLDREGLFLRERPPRQVEFTMISTNQITPQITINSIGDVR